MLQLYTGIYGTRFSFNKGRPLYCFSVFSIIMYQSFVSQAHTLDIAGLKCRDLTPDESQQCRRGAGVLISR